jgi:hypothetical protein
MREDEEMKPLLEDYYEFLDWILVQVETLNL